jgi:hypothetical protein
MYTLPPMMSQQSSLELCLATSSRVKTLDMAAAAAAAAAAAGWIEVDGESSEVVGWLVARGGGDGGGFPFKTAAAGTQSSPPPPATNPPMPPSLLFTPIRLTTQFRLLRLSPPTPATHQTPSFAGPACQRRPGVRFCFLFFCPYLFILG